MAALRTIALTGAFLACVACKRTSPPAPNTDAEAAPATSKLATASSASSDAGKDAGAAKEDEVDLLYFTRATIAVSSKVDNPKDFPEHLVDRDPKTAWNSKTGDLAGAWIAFRVPKDVRVTRLEIIVGFDKVAKDGTDLFTANHRIKKVEVTRDGAALGTFDLDPEKRTLQAIPIGAPGGEYKMKVLETAPGTKKEWRELTVSEFHVMGTTPRLERMGGEQPRVLIGSLDPPAAKTYADYSAAMKAFYPTIEAFCEAQMKHVDLSPSESMRSMGVPQERTKPRCKAARAPKLAEKLKTPFLDMATVSYDESYGSTSTYLLKTSKGWRLAEELGGTYTDDYNPGCPSLFSFKHNESIEAASSNVPALIVHQRYGTYSMGGPDHLVTRIVMACRLQGDETLECDKPVGINERIEINTPESPEKTQPWGADVPFVVKPDGHIERKGDFVNARDESWPQF